MVVPRGIAPSHRFHGPTDELFTGRYPRRGGILLRMTIPTQVDRQICYRVADLGFTVSPREVRSLRETGVIETVGKKKGGRGQVAKYRTGTPEIVAAIELAKVDPTYKRKLFRAILIAWVRGAEVGTAGLRGAYRRHFESEERIARNTLDGKRVEDDEPDIQFPPEFFRSLAAAHLGLSERPSDLGNFEKLTGQTVREIMEKSDTPELLPAVAEGTSLGLAVQRSDGSWRIPRMGSVLWETLALRPQAELARRALREELDVARGPTRAMIQASGFEPSDLVVAGQVPGSIEKLRKWGGPSWWKRELIPLRPEPMNR
jgi:hypothetical protein